MGDSLPDDPPDPPGDEGPEDTPPSGDGGAPEEPVNDGSEPDQTGDSQPDPEPSPNPEPPTTNETQVATQPGLVGLRFAPGRIPLNASEDSLALPPGLASQARQDGLRLTRGKSAEELGYRPVNE